MCDCHGTNTGSTQPDLILGPLPGNISIELVTPITALSQEAKNGRSLPNISHQIVVPTQGRPLQNPNLQDNVNSIIQYGMSRSDAHARKQASRKVSDPKEGVDVRANTTSSPRRQRRQSPAEPGPSRTNNSEHPIAEVAPP